LTLKSQTLTRLLKIGNVRKMVEVAVIEPANSQTDINATYTMEAKQKQINKKEFKSIGDQKNNCAYVATRLQALKYRPSLNSPE
jgi:hypothetical protein